MMKAKDVKEIRGLSVEKLEEKLALGRERKKRKAELERLLPEAESAYRTKTEELAGQKQEAAARRTLVLETKYGAKIYPLDELLHLYLTEGEHKTDILEHLKEEAL